MLQKLKKGIKTYILRKKDFPADEVAKCVFVAQ